MPDHPTPSRNRSGRHPAAQRGFSLVEVCVVIALGAVLLTLAVPGFGALLERQRLHGSAAQLAADLQWLRSEALARNEALRFSLHADTQGSCTVVHTGLRNQCRCEGSGPALCEAGVVVLKTSHWPASERITVQANVASMVFDPVQGTTTPAGSVRLSDSQGRGITHVVNIMGRIRSCSPSALVPGYRAC